MMMKCAQSTLLTALLTPARLPCNPTIPEQRRHLPATTTTTTTTTASASWLHWIHAYDILAKSRTHSRTHSLTRSLSHPPPPGPENHRRVGLRAAPEPLTPAPAKSHHGASVSASSSGLTANAAANDTLAWLYSTLHTHTFI